MKNRRFVAITAAACVALTSAAAPVFAADASADSFTGVLRAQAEKSLASAIANYEEEYQQFEQNIGADMSLTLTPGVGAIALVQGFGLDLSWLQNVAINMTESIVDPEISGDAKILVNGSEIACMEELYDLSTQDILYRIPELSDQSLAMNMNDVIAMTEASLEQAQAGGVEGIDQASLEQLQSSLPLLQLITQIHSIKDIQALLPAPEVLASISQRYLNVLFNNITDVSSEESTVSVDTLSVPATAYTATMGGAELISFVKEAVDTLKDDQEVLPMIQALLAGSEDMSYDDFIQELESTSQMFAEMGPEDMNMEDAPTLDMIIWVDAEGNIVGEHQSMISDGETMEMSFLAPSDGENCALALDYIMPESMSADSGVSEITLAGKGTVADKAVTGDYILTVNGTDLAQIHADNVVCDPEAQTYSGALTASFIAPENSEDYTAAMLSQFAAAINYNMTKEAFDCALTVSMSGMEIATLSLTGAETDAVKTFTKEEFEPAISLTDDAAMNEFVSSIDPTVYLTNLQNAGMPAEFIEQITNLMGGGAEAAAPAAEAAPAN